jgi:hypothetical protein
MWHVGYLSGLSVLALSAAWWRVAAQRIPAAILACATLAVVVVSGIAQLP